MADAVKIRVSAGEKPMVLGVPQIEHDNALKCRVRPQPLSIWGAADASAAAVALLCVLFSPRSTTSAVLCDLMPVDESSLCDTISSFFGVLRPDLINPSSSEPRISTLPLL